jgi:elongation factor G
MRNELGLGAAFVQIPIGLEAEHEGVVDVIEKCAIHFHGEKGTEVVRSEIPDSLVDQCEKVRGELIERLVDIDDEMGEMFLMEEEPTIDDIKAAIRRQTIAGKFVPVFMGSAYKNKGVQPLLDGVLNYLPAPTEVKNTALDIGDEEKEFDLICDAKKGLVALAFKLEESKFGQLTYMRIYQGTMTKGMNVMNTKTNKKVKLNRLVKMHSNEMADVERAEAGDVVAIFGIECSSMDTFTDGPTNISMTSMFVPEAVMSLTVKPKDNQKAANFSKAIGKFTREDPTLRLHTTDDGEIIMSGMGELHLEIYVERMKREYNVECITGTPKV